ncbi:phage Gp37/Gp68 family protein [Myxococcota bacterium]|nr:phage Gp37/Gp68 family protein [Myxococcota bacterium]MBU1382959.1 phage Gp37/Gp68 family protein [Myxococcota bacterium]MBU1495485.1 phage Gp37/Gp68 family protein [Myxococcota bacterium]
MMASTRIEWTEVTWNPVTGCTKISEGCRNCYAERMALRLQAMGQVNYRDGFEVRCHEGVVGYPLLWKKPRMIFVNSMSDLFHEDVPGEFIREIFRVMTVAKQHTFQVLTKRSDILAEMAGELEWPENVWMGVTVESADYVHRIDDLKSVPSFVKFISMEPLISGIPEVDLSGIDWVIAGGESGPGARKMNPLWVKDIRDQCTKQKISFFFKQWGGVNKLMSCNSTFSS